MQHTPTPWRRDYDDDACFVIPHTKSEAQIVCVLGEHSGVADAEDYANAAFIVQAVNAHDALVKAASDLIDVLALQADLMTEAAIAYVPEWNALVDAIHKARGEAPSAPNCS
jgi:hypothetical protein